MDLELIKQIWYLLVKLDKVSLTIIILVFLTYSFTLGKMNPQTLDRVFLKLFGIGKNHKKDQPNNDEQELKK